MTRIDDLPADQQAVLRLLLTQGRSYDEIARSLRMAPAGVRDRAHEALSSLGPSGTALDASRRGQVADYLLGQQEPADADRTRDLLDGDPGARGWARVVAGELGPIATGGLPEIPGATARSSVPVVESARDEQASSRQDAPRAPRSSRRGGMILLAAVGAIAAIAIGFFIGRATNDDDSSTAASTQASTTAAGNVIGQANLTAPKGAAANAADAVGIAQFVAKNGQNLINVVAEKLPTAPKGAGYGIWLEGGGGKPVWLGYFQAVTTQGQVGAQATVESDPRQYTLVRLTQESGKDPTTPGKTFLSGKIQFGSA